MVKATRIGRTHRSHPMIGSSIRPGAYAASGPPEPAARTSRTPSSALAALRVGEEQLLAVQLEVGDRLLALVRDHPVDELLAQLLFHVRMLLRIDQDDAVGVGEALVALDQEL